MELNKKFYTELSKEVSYALRHAPWEYHLEIDDDGWVSLEQLLNSLHCDIRWRDISEKDLFLMIKESEKKRHEILDGKIRAFYGHSIPIKNTKEKKEPPKVLYHGTSKKALFLIMEKGILSQKRQYVHLSKDIETAKNAGMRYDNMPCILKIDSEQAWKDGIAFYYGNEKIWLADEVPSKYITEVKYL